MSTLNASAEIKVKNVISNKSHKYFEASTTRHTEIQFPANFSHAQSLNNFSVATQHTVTVDFYQIRKQKCLLNKGVVNFSRCEFNNNYFYKLIRTCVHATKKMHFEFTAYLFSDKN
jgi:hypothetical protein